MNKEIFELMDIFEKAKEKFLKEEKIIDYKANITSMNLIILEKIV